MFHRVINSVLGKGGVNCGMLQTSPIPLQQSPQFARTLAALDVPLVSRAPVVMERQFKPLGRIRFASRIHSSDLHLRPRIINAENNAPDLYRAAGYRQIITPAHIARWDLTLPDRHAHMSGKWRNQLRKGQRANLRIRELAWDGSAHWLFENAARIARERKFRPLPQQILAIFAQLNKNAGTIFEAYDKGTPVAACLVLKHGSTATYQTAWSNAQGHGLQAPRVLLDHAAKRLTSWGYHDFDLGLVETDHASGLARFKLGTGATLTQLGGTWLHMGRVRPLAPDGVMA